MGRNSVEEFVCLGSSDPPKTVIGNVQTVEIVPDLKVFEQTSEVFPSKEQAEPSKVSWPNGSNSPEKGLTWLTLTSLKLGPDVSTPEHDIVKKVDLLGCAEWDPADQQETREILREYADVFTKDDFDLR